ncbi:MULTISPECIES: bifunctional ADP-dependent NAD(P)H-hydrate dehydratase/NAD(P)H-hydrate epimerase [unclassified Hydrotalea]|uniref:bifunctional ADP-dependent NAD(P)H-hydrate dehydratase/NAD(P)H-hydrate epimerase n=1 Tax=unclassified Hydrotalea TaxID=2643788 RepID=UPI000942A83F|nr:MULTISPECIES: bifunctional ADP-dependent NAD(P)H-hydrate dehydratase/NAD(P)H-hydrate epimerase [unclassified Hydrotalea]RWZ88595.1 MAG: bifunctional ADP-dependent NAD(P)H-hydrate dehydratase/NAD(P)H-hydrate epimerase [Hydrotalea sp. AMD]
MKLLSAAQLQQWDAFTVQHEPIASIHLMERAALACTKWLLQQNFIQQPVFIFCGKGNNGGDGLAIARQLFEAGIIPSVYILEFGRPGTDNFQENLHRLHILGLAVQYISTEALLPIIPENAVIIDALLGAGLNKPLSGLYAIIVQHINKAHSIIISIDVPTGMFIDSSVNGGTVVSARHTLSFQCYKLCFLAAENAPYFGKVHILDIGLHPQFLQKLDTTFSMIELDGIQQCISVRNPFAHKGAFGHALLIAGSTEKMGAALMATGAALRSGCGLVTTQVPAQAAATLNIRYPEAMLLMREAGLNDFTPYTSVGIGPGLDVNDASVLLLQQLIAHYDQPMVIDADALNIIAQHKDWLQQLPAGTILTPHPKEFDRVFGTSANEFERIEKAVQLSAALAITVVLKGHYTLVAHQGKGSFNTSGNVGLAKGGSGDVLTGIITALLAQGYAPQTAAQLGVYLHGLAADLALEIQSEESLLATDVIENLGKAFSYCKPTDFFNH